MGTFKESEHPRGPDGRFIKKSGPVGGLVIAALIIVALLAWSSHAATGSTGQSHQASTGQSKQAWSQAGLTFTEQRSDTGNTCVADAYGQVRLFLTAHPCVNLDRALYLVTDGAGHTMSVAVATVTMPVASAATSLRTLVDRAGTGNITEFGHGIAGEVQFTGLHYASSRNGATVHIAESEPRPGTAVPAAVLHLAAVTGMDAPER